MGVGRGEPSRDYEIIVNLIAETKAAKGLTVTCRLDHRKYPTGRKVTAEEMNQVNLYPEKFHGEWNYVIKLGGVMMTQLRQRMLEELRRRNYSSRLLEPFDCTSGTSPNSPNIFIARPINSERRTFVGTNCS
jgi:hypothetical protein